MNIETKDKNPSFKNKINILPQWYQNIPRDYSFILPKWIDVRISNVCELWDNKLDKCGLVKINESLNPQSININNKNNNDGSPTPHIVIEKKNKNAKY